MEPIGDVGETLSGLDVISDLLERIGEDLAKSAWLRDCDAYQDYAGKIVIELQLHDIDTTTVQREIVIGDDDGSKPSRRFEIEIPAAPAAVVRQRSSLASPSLERDVSNAPDANADASDASTTRRWRAPYKRKA